ncbi:MAG: hypothetical protein R3Y58_13685, partial [Eubacteriales bacterium]
KDKTLPSEVVRMIGSITGAKTFMNQEKGEEINMCRALEAYVAEKTDEAVKEAEKRGINIGKNEGINTINSMRAANATSDQIIERLIQQMSTPKERNI